MKNFLSLFLLVSFFSFSSISAQDVKNAKANNRDNPTKKYMRPSLTIIYANRGSDRSDRMNKIVNAYPVPGKFNDHNVKTQAIKVNGDNIKSTLDEALNNQVSREIVAKWFSRNAKGEFNMNLIGERGMYNASDADFLKAQASERKTSLLRDAGENLLDRSYILVYDVNNIFTKEEWAAKNKVATDREGYVATYNCYLFRLNWNDSVAAVFYNNLWVDASNPSADKIAMFDKTNFPVEYVTTVSNAFGTVECSQYKDHSKNIFGSLSDDELFAGIWNEIIKETDVSLAKANEDFKVKVPVFSTQPIEAKIGLKEGLSVDRRFFAYEFQLDSDGKKIAKRKAVVRAGSKIADNREVASGKSATSSFYQVAGGKVYEGMLLQENPDWGIGLTFGYGAVQGAIGEGANITLEASVSQSVGRAVGGSFPTGLKIYGTAAMGIANFKSIEIPFPNGSLEDAEYSSTSLVAGLSKDMYFFRCFVFVPYVGYGIESLSNVDDLKSEDKYNFEFIQFGARLGLNIRYNVQIIGSAYVSSIIKNEPDKKNTIGDQSVADKLKDERGIGQYTAGLRFLF